MATSTETARLESDDRICLQDAAAPPPPQDTTRMEPFEVNDEVTALEPEYPTGLKFWLSSLSICFVLILVALDINIVATAVPAITDHFHTVADVGWYSTAFRLSSCAFQFMFGKLYMIFSIKRVFMLSIAVFLVGSVLCATAASSAMFGESRARVFEIMTVELTHATFSLLGHLCPLRHRPLYTSLFGLIESLAVAAAPSLGGVLTQRLGWRWCFYISLPIGVVTLMVMTFCLSDPKRNTSADMTWKEIVDQLNLLGNLVFVPSIACLFIALSWAGIKYPWNDPKVIGLLITFSVLLAAFIWEQHRKQDAATLPPRIFKERSVISGFVFAITCNAGINVVEYYAPTYFQIVRGWSPIHSGYLMLPNIIGQSIGFMVCGSGTSMFGYYTPFALLGSVLSPIAAGLMTTWKVDTNLGKLIGYFGLFGFATAVGFQAPQSAVQTLPPSDVPLGMAAILFAQSFGPAVSVAVAQTIFTAQLSKNLHHLLPNVNAQSIENMGFGELKANIGPENLEKALLGFDESLIQSWYLAVGLSCATVVGSLMMEWRSVKQKKT